MKLDQIDDKVVLWYHTLSGWAQFAIAAGVGFVLGALMF